MQKKILITIFVALLLILLIGILLYVQFKTPKITKTLNETNTLITNKTITPLSLANITTNTTPSHTGSGQSPINNTSSPVPIPKVNSTMNLTQLIRQFLRQQVNPQYLNITEVNDTNTTFNTEIKLYSIRLECSPVFLDTIVINWGDGTVNKLIFSNRTLYVGSVFSTNNICNLPMTVIGNFALLSNGTVLYLYHNYPKGLYHAVAGDFYNYSGTLNITT